MAVPEYTGLWDTRRPDSSRIPIFYPDAAPVLQLYPGLDQIAIDIGGKQLAAAYAYGSSFNGESTNGMLDLMLIVKDPRLFHEENRFWRPDDYTHLIGGVRVQTWLNRFSPNFYHREDTLDNDQDRSLKYGVIPLHRLLYDRWSDCLRGNFYVAGRVQKARIIPLFMNPKYKAQIDSTINSARVEGVWLALGLVSPKFSWEDLVINYINLSYAADIRAEKANKDRIILEQSPGDYQAMFEDLLVSFIDHDIIEKVGEVEYQKKLSPREEDVTELLKSASRKSLRYNIKNIFTCGPIRAYRYDRAKLERSKIPKKKTLQEAVV